MANRTQPNRGTRRRRNAVAVLGVLVGASLAGWLPIGADGHEAEAQGPSPPNVVVIMTDDQDLASLQVMDNVRRHIAQTGVTFENAFATFPLCCPSRATFLTGQYAHNHGVMSNEPPDGGYEAFQEAGSLPVAMRRGGYRTGFVGKYLNRYGLPVNGSRRAVPRGWSDWRGLIRGTPGGSMYDYELNENGQIQHYGTRARDYQTDVLAQKASRFVVTSARRDKPFFLTFSTLAPHQEADKSHARNPRPAPRHRDRFERAPLPKPPSFNEADVSDKPSFIRFRPRLTSREVRAVRERYQDRLASLLAVDDAVGRLVKRLRRSGELRRTLIVFTSDNGYLLGEHRRTGKNTLYEESVGTPLVLRGPGVPRGESRRQVVGNIDLAPTILQAADAEPLLTMDGRSLLPLARRPGRATRRDILFENGGSEAVRTPGYMYAEHPDEEFELYDLRNDPFQLRSRHDAPAFDQVRERLARRLQQLRDCAGRGCR